MIENLLNLRKLSKYLILSNLKKNIIKAMKLNFDHSTPTYTDTTVLIKAVPTDKIMSF